MFVGGVVCCVPDPVIRWRGLVIHRQITPTNVLWEPRSRSLRLLDFETCVIHCHCPPPPPPPAKAAAAAARMEGAAVGSCWFREGCAECTRRRRSYSDLCWSPPPPELLPLRGPRPPSRRRRRRRPDAGGGSGAAAVAAAYSYGPAVDIWVCCCTALRPTDDQAGSRGPHSLTHRPRPGLGVRSGSGPWLWRPVSVSACMLQAVGLITLSVVAGSDQLLWSEQGLTGGGSSLYASVLRHSWLGRSGDDGLCGATTNSGRTNVDRVEELLDIVSAAAAAEHGRDQPRALMSSAEGGAAGRLGRLLAASLEWRPAARISAAEAVALLLD